MATVTEMKFGSREGSTWSMYEPASGTFRLFTVLIDDQDDDARATLRSTRLAGPKGELVREGSSHPWDDNLYARDFTLGERLNNVTWRVQVYYAPKELMVGTLNGWMPRVTTASSFVHRDESIQTRWGDKWPAISSGEAVISASNTSLLRNGIKTVASLRYTAVNKTDPLAPTATHWAETSDGKRVDLIQTKTRDTTRGVGFDYEQSQLILTMDKEVLTVPRSHAMSLAYYKGRVNSQVFLSRVYYIPVGHCKFVNGDVSIVSGKPAGSLNAGMFYHVQLVFLISADHLGFHRLTHYFEHEGAIHPVIREDSGKIQQEDFKAAMQSDLNGLLGMFV